MADKTELYAARAAIMAETEKVQRLREFYLTEYKHGASDTELVSWRRRDAEAEGQLKAYHIAQGILSKLISGVSL